MRFLVDEQLPRRLAVWLRERGLSADHVLKLGLASYSDRCLIVERLGQTGVVLSKDIDFVNDRRAGETYRVVRVTTGNLGTKALLAKVEAEWPRVSADLAAGKLVIELPIAPERPKRRERGR